MNHRIFIILLFLNGIFLNGQSQTTRKEQLFDGDWKFCLGDINGAEKQTFNDKKWRDIDLPHDWSIEKLPNQETGKVVGPFLKESIGSTATGYTVGGTAWYRKIFTLNPKEKYNITIISFDGVYMNCDVWVNGKFLGNHPYGYTPFNYDITRFLNSAGKPNVIAVKVKNEGKNSRWYSGSGIYRHVWLIQKQDISIAHNGVYITTENISAKSATMKIVSSINNINNKNADVKILINVIEPDGKISQTAETQSKNYLW